MSIISHFPQGGGGGGQEISPARKVRGRASEAIVPGNAVYTTYNFDVVKSTLGPAPIECIARLNDLVVVGKESTTGAALYTVSGDGTLTYKSDIPGTRGIVYAAKFYTVENQDTTTSDFLVLGGTFSGLCKVFSVAADGTVQYIQDIATELTAVYSIAVGPYSRGISIVLGGSGNLVEIWNAWITIQKMSSIKLVNGNVMVPTVGKLDLTPDGGTLAVGWAANLPIGDRIGGTKLHNMESFLEAPTYLAGMGHPTFSPNGSYIVVGLANKAEVYRKDTAGGYTYAHDIPADAHGGALDGYALDVIWSPDGTKALVIGAFDYCAKLYSVSSDGQFTFLRNLLDTGSKKLSGRVEAALYQDSAITLGGAFDQCLARYTLENGLPKVQTVIHKVEDMAMPYGVVSEIGYADTHIAAQATGEIQCIVSTGGI